MTAVKAQTAAKKWLIASFKVQSEHSRTIGPSSATRCFNCLGSVLWTADMPDEETEYSALGTFAHSVAEYCRVYEVEMLPLLDLEIKYSKDFTFIIDKEMVTCIQGFIDRAGAFEGDAFFEKRVCFDEYIADGFGTMDDIRIADKVCKITDLKYGMGVPVSAIENDQLKLGALGIMQEFEFLYEIDEFILCIDQPRLDFYEEWEITSKKLVKWADKFVIPKALIALKPNAPFKSDIGQEKSWCRFCRGRKICKTRSLDALSIDITNQEISDDEHAELLDKIPGIESWCKDIHDSGLEKVRKGIHVGDYKIVAGKRSRNWSSEKTAETMFRKARVKVSQFRPAKFVSPAQGEELVGKDAVAEVSEYQLGIPTLVPGSDKRPSLEIIADGEFTTAEE